MRQNNIWMNYLGLGIFSLFLLSSCNKNELIKVDWIYINDTNHEISVKYRFEPFTIEPFGKYIFEQDVVIEKKRKNTPYSSKDFYLIDIIVYDSIKCDSLKSFEIGPWNVSNYQIEAVNASHDQLTYHFTEDDYERAINCE